MSYNFINLFYILFWFLVEIMCVGAGNHELNIYLNKYQLDLILNLGNLLEGLIPLCFELLLKTKCFKTWSNCRHSRKPWPRFINADTLTLSLTRGSKLSWRYNINFFISFRVYWLRLYVNIQAINFLEKHLRYDHHQDRLTAREAMVRVSSYSKPIYCFYWTYFHQTYNLIALLLLYRPIHNLLS